MIKTTSAAIGLSLLVSACATTRVPPVTAPGADFLVRNGSAKRVVTTASGLQYFVVKAGPKGGQSPNTGQEVTFDYEGKLTTGEVFDSSFARGEPISGDIDAFVPGFSEALKLMKPGDEWIVWIPPALGYGDRAAGTIPPNSILRFRLALRKVGAATPTP